MASIFTDFKQTLSRSRNKLLSPLERRLDRNPRQKQRLLKLFSYILLSVKAAVSVFGAVFFILNVRDIPGRVLPASTEEPLETFIPSETENPIQKRIDNNRVDASCKGGTFYPILDFDIVGEEPFNYIDKTEQIVSVEGTLNYQAEVRTQWECPMPFKAIL